MSTRLGWRQRAFAPTAGFTALTALACAAFFLLGRWQWHRGELRQAEWDRFAAGTDRIEPLGDRGLAEVPRFQRVSLVGRYEPQRQFLLDNRSYAGRPGYEVLTPFKRTGGTTALVDRGWVPFSGRRSELPAIDFLPAAASSTVAGRSADLPSAGLASGRSAPAPGAAWPKPTSFPTMPELSRALGVALEGRIVLLDPHAPDGFTRDWHPPGIEPMRNWAYAIQWWCFAFVAVLIWGRLSLRERKPG